MSRIASRPVVGKKSGSSRTAVNACSDVASPPPEGEELPASIGTPFCAEVRAASRDQIARAATASVERTWQAAAAALRRIEA